MQPSFSPITPQIPLPVANSQGSILMVEDNHELRQSIAEYLTRVGFKVTAVDTGLKFYHTLAEQSFQMAVIDIGLPDISGLQLADYIRKNTSMSCIILTAHDSIDDRVSGYDAGADLYMVKPVDCRELASAISRMMQRTSCDTPSQKPKPAWCFNSHNATLITPEFAIIPLTSREIDFIRVLAVSAGQYVPRETILTEMGYSVDEFSQNAMESLIRRLRRKIEHSFGSSPILTRHGIGYSFSAPLTLC